MGTEINLNKPFEGLESCPIQSVLAVNDTLNVLQGKWKLAIITALLFDVKRYTDIKNTIPRITPRMLSKELKELEMNGIVSRKVYDTTPVRIEYELTESGKSLKGLLEVMIDWGKRHRENTISNNK